VAQSGSAPALGAGRRRFKSCHPDHLAARSLTAVALRGLTVLVLAAGWVCLGACGKPDADAPAVEPLPEVSAAPSAVAASRPATEEAVLRAATEAIVRRDLAALKDTAAPELAADLERIFGNGPDEFWARGDVLVANVNSGVRVAQVEDGSRGRWRVLFVFGNGVEESMTFARIDGELRLDQL
jgi:hypothetical protein